MGGERQEARGGNQPSLLDDHGTVVETFVTQTQPFEIVFGFPVEFFRQFYGQIDPASPDRLFMQNLPFGAELAFGFFPFIQSYLLNHDPRASSRA